MQDRGRHARVAERIARLCSDDGYGMDTDDRQILRMAMRLRYELGERGFAFAGLADVIARILSEEYDDCDEGEAHESSVSEPERRDGQRPDRPE